MWLNESLASNSALAAYRDALRHSLLHSAPTHIVIDRLFDDTKLEQVLSVLQQPHLWETQNHTYSALYVENTQWQKTSNDQRFVQRDIWQREVASTASVNFNMAEDFLSFLRGAEFMAMLSRIFNVALTDENVSEPAINTNYFRLGANDFIKQHADDSPGREICMLLYLNKDWRDDGGGELVFMGKDNLPISIAPLFNRCVLFDPSSTGSEHWVEKMSLGNTDDYRYNVTSWYWSE